MRERRIELQKKKLSSLNYQIISTEDPFKYIFKKDGIEYDVEFGIDYPFKPAKIIKKTQTQDFQYRNLKQWSPAINLEMIFKSDKFFIKKYKNQQLIQKLLQGKQQNSKFQKLSFDSPFTSMSLLKPVATYPNESFDFIIAPLIKDNKVIKDFFKLKNVNLISFDHGAIVIGIYIHAFDILCRIFNLSIENGYEILLSDPTFLSPKHKLFLHICFADLFKSGIRLSNKEKEDITRYTNQYIDLLRESGLLTIQGYNYEDIHNNTLIFFKK